MHKIVFHRLLGNQKLYPLWYSSTWAAVSAYQRRIRGHHSRLSRFSDRGWIHQRRPSSWLWKDRPPETPWLPWSHLFLWLAPKLLRRNASTSNADSHQSQRNLGLDWRQARVPASTICSSRLSFPIASPKRRDPCHFDRLEIQDIDCQVRISPTPLRTCVLATAWAHYTSRTSYLRSQCPKSWSQALRKPTRPLLGTCHPS